MKKDFGQMKSLLDKKNIEKRWKKKKVKINGMMMNIRHLLNRAMKSKQMKLMTALLLARIIINEMIKEYFSFKMKFQLLSILL